jgi:hypothetical protein
LTGPSAGIDLLGASADLANYSGFAIKANPLHSELIILGWILYEVCSNEGKRNTDEI